MINKNVFFAGSALILCNLGWASTAPQDQAPQANLLPKAEKSKGDCCDKKASSAPETPQTQAK